LFDEPTTGLHFDDVAKLLTAFRQLIAAGHSLVAADISPFRLAIAPVHLPSVPRRSAPERLAHLHSAVLLC
jgi:predicted ATPase